MMIWAFSGTSHEALEASTLVEKTQAVHLVNIYLFGSKYIYIYILVSTMLSFRDTAAL